MSTTPPVPEGHGEASRGWRLAAWIVAAWTAWALFWITEPLAMTGRLSHRDEALEWFHDAATWALLTFAIFWLARRFPPRRGRLARNVPVLLAAALLVSFCSTTSSWVYEAWRGKSHEMSYPQRLAHGVRWNTSWYCYVLGIGLAVHYHHEARRRQRQAARLALVASGLEARVAQAQLSAARMRLQPELVFATLDAVARLAPRDPAAADALTVSLADLLRMAADSFGASEVPLRRDAAYLSAWAAIRRFHGLGPQVHLELVDEALAAAVPAFLLQPLAVALVDDLHTSHVHVRARIHGGELQVEIVSHGCAPLADTAALDEARNRLRQSHGPSSVIDLVSADGTRAVRVCLPCREPAERALPLAAER